MAAETNSFDTMRFTSRSGTEAKPSRPPMSAGLGSGVAVSSVTCRSCARKYAAAAAAPGASDIPLYSGIPLYTVVCCQLALGGRENGSGVSVHSASTQRGC